MRRFTDQNSERFSEERTSFLAFHHFLDWWERAMDEFLEEMWSGMTWRNPICRKKRENGIAMLVYKLFYKYATYEKVQLFNIQF